MPGNKDARGRGCGARILPVRAQSAALTPTLYLDRPLPSPTYPGVPQDLSRSFRFRDPRAGDIFTRAGAADAVTTRRTDNGLIK